MKKNLMAPSILAADFTILGEQIKTVADAGADYIHIDVMDGEFVSSISFGMPLIKSIRKVTDKFFDVHLMVQNPERYIKDFVDCGADGITVHLEATKDIEHCIKEIRKYGVRVGLSINPGTSLEPLRYLYDKVDMILCMTVNPGFGGQTYIESSTQKIKDLRSIIDEKGLDIDLEVDGGITKDNIETVLDAGANVIVMGSSVFRGDITENVTYFRKVLDEHE